MIEDKVLKENIEKFQNNEDCFDKIKELLSEFIYHYPSFAYEVFDEDIKGDFYIYVLDRLEKIILSYKIQENTKFKTFFYLVLKRQYLNFIKTQKHKPEQLGLEDEWAFYSENFPEKLIKLETVSMIFASLSPKYRLILKLHCPDFLLPEDLFEIAKEFKKTPASLLENIDIILNDIARQEEKYSKSFYTKLNKKIPLTSPKAIAAFLEVKPNQVSKWLLQIRRSLEEKLENPYVS